MSAQKLREVIEAYGSSLGNTEEGKAWCIKALHPSDPLTEVRGIPDRSAGCTVMLNFQQQVVIAPPTSSAGKWSSEINILPDPIQPLFHYDYDTGSAHAQFGNMVNTQFGASTPVATGAWLGAFEQWRLCYMGASCYLNASEMYNEGICTAAQHVAHPFEVGMSMGTGAGATATGTIAKIQMWATADDPPYDVLVRMPSVYTGDAKAGCYMPIKLDSNHQRWRSSQDIAYTFRAGSNIAPYTYTFPATALTPTLANWPYSDCVGAWASTGTPGGIMGDIHMQFLNDNIGKIIFTNMNLAGTLTVVLRYGIEARVNPNSAYTAFQALAPPYDPVAENTYFAVARELKDAYPVEYNDFGKLWDVIKNVASTIDPFLGLIPGGDMVRMVGKGIGSAVDMVRSKDRSPLKGPPDGPSPAALAKATESAHLALARIPKRAASNAARRIAKPRREKVETVRVVVPSKTGRKIERRRV